MGRTVVIDEEECLGCESCVELCPSTFIFDSDAGKAQVAAPESSDACIEEAISSCPAACIDWRDG